MLPHLADHRDFSSQYVVALHYQAKICSNDLYVEGFYHLVCLGTNSSIFALVQIATLEELFRSYIAFASC